MKRYGRTRGGQTMGKRFLLDENNNKIEVTDEVGNTTVEEIKCCVSETPYKMAFVTQAKYNELEAAGGLQINTIYEIIDDTTADEIDQLLSTHGNYINNIMKLILNQKRLYKHNVVLQKGFDDLEAYLTIYNTTRTQFTLETLREYLTTNKEPLIGFYTDTDDIERTVYYIRKNDNNNIVIGYLIDGGYHVVTENETTGFTDLLVWDIVTEVLEVL